MYVARMIGGAFARMFWGILGELTDAWGTAMCWLLLPGEKLGLWRLRRASEQRGAPHMTRRLAVLIQAVALTIEGCAIACAAYKLVMLYRFGKA